ncbi:hypothetical protein [Streptomyces sp. NPDC086010]|uniref:hypothetical protein n=1 Tax=Streptomyces sp. NPDC086010 TaxID=3365745 RepID=UPI0037CD389E
MRLLIDVVEGDFSAFHGPYGNGTVQRMRGLEHFAAAAASRKAVDRSARWRDLHQAAFGRAFELPVAPSATVAECLAAALGEARRRGVAGPEGEPDGPWADRVLRTWLADPATDERLDPGLTLGAYGLADGDLIVLCIEHPSPGAYTLDSSPNPAALLDRMQLEMSGAVPDHGGMLWGVLLYTSVDTELATYVRTHFEDLDALSGPSTRVFVMERRTPWADARRYWRGHLEPELYQVLAPMRWLRRQPYDPQGAYRIASLLKVDPALLPCLVLFNGRADLPWGKQKVVFPVEEATPRYFRTLFGRIAEALGGRPGAGYARPEYDDPPAGAGADGETVLRDLLLRSARDRDEEAFARVAEAQDAISAALRPTPAPHTGYQLNNCKVILTSGTSGTSGAVMTENFHFNGQNTTFINRPKDTVVQDFQNQHGTTLCADDLRQLLGLTLSSTELSDTERDEAAQAVHDLATLSGEPDVGAFRLRAERLRELLAGAADIAQPALALLATVTAAVTG